MSHFQRMQYRIAPHYLHDYEQAPMGLHPVMPLMPMMPFTYGAPGLGYTPSDFFSGRKWASTLRETGANTAVYAAYDNYADLDEIVTRDIGAGRNYKKGMTDLSAISTWADMSTLGASDSGAKLKTAYMLKLAGLILEDDGLIEKAKMLADAGVKEGEAPGAGSQISKISSVYSNAASVLQKNSKFQSKSSALPLQQIMSALSKGTDTAAVKARRRDYEDQQGNVNANIPTDEGGTKKTDFEKALPYLIYGVTGAVVLGAGFWAYGRYRAASKANPNKGFRRTLSVRPNPSAPGRTDNGPEEEIASMPKAREQETRMNKHVFKRNA
jgi:hypothetical protein